MLSELVDHIERHTGMSAQQARAALGLVLNAAERQGAPIARQLFECLPGMRTLAAAMGAEVGGSTGVIARLIEQTPGGRLAVAEEMLDSLRSQGVPPTALGALFPAIESFMESEFGLRGVGHLGDILGGSDAGMGRLTG